ncbi:MAG: hypothetical protein SGBAC_007523 [Bacillariaceae sp.]
MSMTLMMHQDHLSSHPSTKHESFVDKHIQTTAKKGVNTSNNSQKLDDGLHNVAGLDCSAHGGPSNDLAEEMVYWKNLPNDESYVSPFQDPDQRRYLTFEPDGGGWNNIRMSMETVLAMAIATGRVLVLPPSQKMYLLGGTDFSFADFFPLHSIAKEHPGLEIITMKQFLEETNGKLKNTETNQISYPPHNTTEWDGNTATMKNELNPWLRTIAYNADWNPDKCLAGFPASKTFTSESTLTSTFEQVNSKNVNFEQFFNQPTSVNGTVHDRMAEFIAGRNEMCIYDNQVQREQVVHFAGKAKLAGGRLLVHFYAFLFFADWKTDLWMKRFVRDHVRYIDDIQCAAARIVAAVREDARKKISNNPDGIFDSFHIRRGDFQYKKTRVEAMEILKAAKDEIPEGTFVYVATDERDKKFFADMEGYWNVVYMDNYMHLLDGVNKNFFGMIDQLVSSRGRTFFGCWFSTFTGYITRLRGYHSQNAQAEGYEMGLLPDTYYYAVIDHKKKLHDFWPVKKLYYAREYPVSWRNIDFDAPI